MSAEWTIARVFRRVLMDASGVAVRAFDGSTSGPADPIATVVLHDETALRYLVRAPGDLGVARAYVSGSLDVEGDLHHALVSLVHARHDVKLWRELMAAAPAAQHLLPYLRGEATPPAVEAPARWRRGLRHSMRRDARAVSHHYDVSNTFYEWVLGPSMTYTCAVFPDGNSSLETAQATKYELVCEKLALQPGMRLLDVGCGWGGMVMHAAEHHGVNALGVTLSRRQAEWAAKQIADRGLSGVAEVRHLDYRDVPNEPFDAISSIGLTEHIGRRNLPSYFADLYARLRPQGRLLNHCITRPAPGTRAKAGAFIDRYVFPDGELESPGSIMEEMNRAGFEVRHAENLREHYAMTLRDWGRNLEQHWEQAVAEVGLEKARVWRLYMAASRAGFDCDNIQLHQILGVKDAATPTGLLSGFPLRPSY